MTEPGAPADFDAMIGLRVVSYDGDVLGTLEEVYHDVGGGPPRWAVVRLDVDRHGFVPLTGARRHDGLLRIPYGRRVVDDAADRMPPTGQLTAEEEARLDAHFGGEGAGELELVVAEEQLHVATAARAAGVVHVRKVIVTEDVTVTVTLRREELRMEPVALPDPVPVAAADDDADDHKLDDVDSTLLEVTLYEEVPVVQRRVVPRERVTVRRTVVTDRIEVTEPVRREQVAVDQEDLLA
jgi:uncharacterized protein (TIGR02271 family)